MSLFGRHARYSLTLLFQVIFPLIAAESTIVVLIFTFLVVYFTSNSIIVPLQSLENKMVKVSENKDLTIRSNLVGKDEIADMGQAFNSMLISFHDILSKMK